MNNEKVKIGAIVITLLFLGTALYVPVRSVPIEKNKIENITVDTKSEDSSNSGIEDFAAYWLDRQYIIEPITAPINLNDNDDAGYKKDVGNEISRSMPIYPGEIIDDTQGRGRTGKISSSDKEDWYYFAACNGQQIHITLTPPSGFNFDLGLWDEDENELATSTKTGNAAESIIYTATYLGDLYIRIVYISGTGEGQYSFDVTLNNQNDANTGQDAGDDFSTATLLTPGYYHGYLDMNDAYDWYKFNVNSGQGIHFILQTKFAIYSDFDIELYNPSGSMVYRETYYGEDELLYPADTSGYWQVKIYLFPGWTDIPHPTNWKYYAYGSGPYNLTFKLESSAPNPSDPIPQPQITPIAQTFIIANDPTSSKDEYGYFASIPASNYLADGQRYLSPIIYSGDSTPTAYYDDPTAYGTVDDTTQYLINDWNDYLALYGKTPTQYTVPTEPIQAAADIATKNWQSSTTAVVAIDGSTYQDSTKDVLTRTATLERKIEVTPFNGNDSKINKNFGYELNLWQKWGAISIKVNNLPSATTTADLVNLWPKFIALADDWWPDSAGEPRTDIYYPITKPGIWAAQASSYSVGEQFEITKYGCDRYKIKLSDADQTLKVTVKTTEQSDLLVFLVDPSGNIRAPLVEAWNGATVNPIHVWNGHSDLGFDEFRGWNPAPHTEFSAEVLHPEAGVWTAIVVPRNAVGSSSIKYTITGTVKTLNSKGTDAAMSAANAAVIASQKHLPLLYVSEDSVPAETASAFSALGVTKVIFVERNNIGSAVRSKLPTISTDLKTMKEIVDYIKADASSDNYITITSLRTGVGYAATGAMLAAYHGSPVLRIEEAPGNPAGISDTVEAYFRWDGDYYHGERSNGHIARATAPVPHGFNVTMQMFLYFLTGGKSGSIPPLGMDADKTWFEAIYNGIHNMIQSYNLDKSGQEGYCFVAPRNEITIPVYAALMGNNSYTGGIPGITPAYSSDIIVRNILYPALIYANPNRDVTTMQLMNFPDGGSWKTNDKKTTPVYASRNLKESFSSHNRIFDPHVLWEAHLQRLNDGASVMYYSGHGTGGSGISAQYKKTDYSTYPDQEWWDGWRGYMYDNWKNPRNGGFTWYNPESPNLYDIIHYKYVDQLMENLRSNAIFYMSCTTGDGDGPMVYLDHGAVCWYGNAGTGLCPEADLADDIFFDSTLKEGQMIGPAFSTQVWLHFRDYTTSDPTAMYGVSSLYGGASGGGVTTRQVIYGDPNLIIYSPEWTAPVPINSNI
jgi:hypothetical protein